MKTTSEGDLATGGKRYRRGARSDATPSAACPATAPPRRPVRPHDQAIWVSDDHSHVTGHVHLDDLEGAATQDLTVAPAPK
jgi:hypothetical protein